MSERDRPLLEHDAGAAERRAARAWPAGSWALTHGASTELPGPRPAADHGANVERPTCVKATYDPGDVFRFDQSVPVRPAGRS